MVTPVEISGRRVGPGSPCFIIAEAGVNHNGAADLARQLVDAAAESGADAVKFQTFKSDELATPSAPKAAYQSEQAGDAESQREMLRKLELPPEAFRSLQGHCRTRGIQFLSTPFEEESADFLDQLGVAAFKIPSGEITNLNFLKHVAQKNRPVILSTGMSTLSEVAAAVSALRGTGNAQIALLHCTSNYPASPADANLRAMLTMAKQFNLPIGYSDHTPGNETALAAVALGACIIEKHFTMDRTLAGPDHKSSLNPKELRKFVQSIRTVEAALGDGEKKPATAEANVAKVARKSLVAARDIPANSTVTEEMITARRPGTGLSPAMQDQIIGRKTRVSIPAETLLALDMFS